MRLWPNFDPSLTPTPSSAVSPRTRQQLTGPDAVPGRLLLVAEDKTRPTRVMQSFGAPLPTTNPYIHLLDEALSSTRGLEHLRYGRRRALLGRYDAVHLHWPESLLGGRTRPRSLARRLTFAALLARWHIMGTAIVRTVHNVELPQDVTRWERRMLRCVERRTDFRILLNVHTSVPLAAPHSVIPHGDFRSWYARTGTSDILPEVDAIAFVGLIRRYKGVEQLLSAFIATASSAPHLRLRVSGNPSSDGLATEIRALAADDARVSVDLRFLDEREFANAVGTAEGIVLPYRFMHNSGAVIAALSLNRPVLVPRNDVNEALAEEVGPGWIEVFDAEIDADDLAAFLPHVRERRISLVPNLAEREWDDVGVQHLDAYRRAIAAHRARR